jgi:arsenical pump membrane protein
MNATASWLIFVGGDLGPRLLPFGSLAGLLWRDALRREGQAVSYRTFAHVGIVTTVPPLLVGALVVDALAG